ncbi:MAG: YbaN family protein [Motiliproteus sp.]
MNIVYRTVGVISLGLGTLGAFLPLLPTTCFVLLAAWCFAKSSPRWHAWLLSNKLLGGTLVRWQRYRCISSKTKYIATASMLASGSYSLLMLANPVLQIILLGALVAGIYSIWSLNSCRVEMTRPQ